MVGGLAVCGVYNPDYVTEIAQPKDAAAIELDVVRSKGIIVEAGVLPPLLPPPFR